MNQGTLFSGNRIKQVNVYEKSGRTDSRTALSSTKLTEVQKAAVREICKTEGVTESTFISEGLEILIRLYPHRAKLVRHWETLDRLLNIIDGNGR